ncbi:transposase [Fischerella thermalis]|uniref:Transposase n=1 Tax=Fischerella thermalis CCMEE 5318 TaxID=2019666 RepID=A0A2N6LNY4_9CYAN|nr:transposase [Fischerella thermalis]PMB27376.1 transposase [Fischerella thermalis CCMEE 5318]BAZ71169.1 hypothetical protein NIES4106_59660 [Fischerella sp. NIES-4106]
MSAIKYTFAYYYISPDHAEKLTAFQEASGDARNTLINQFVRGWIGRNRETYRSLARFDAEKRDISYRQWGEIIVNQGVEALPSYKEEIGDIPDNPLKNVVLGSELIKHPINYIWLGVENIAFLKIAIHYDRDTNIGFISRIVKEHLDRNWDTLYAPQVAADNFENWI